MTWREGTMLVMAACVVVLIGWDIVVAFLNDTPNEEDTESGIIQGWFKVGIWPLAWAWGGLGAHFFMPGVAFTQVSTFGILVLLASGVLDGVGHLSCSRA